MALDTVADYVKQVRIKVQDLVPDYRYTDEQIVEYLNEAILESRRIRPDLWLPLSRNPLPQYTISNMATAVPIDQMYRTAFVYYMAGQAQLSDQEDTEDQRAAAFIQKFAGQLTAGQV